MVLAVSWEFYQSDGMEGLISLSYGLLHRLFGLLHVLEADSENKGLKRNQMQAVAFYSLASEGT